MKSFSINAILCLYGIALCFTGATSRRVLLEFTAKNSDPFVCPDTGNHPIPGLECTKYYYSCATGTPVNSSCLGTAVFEPSTHLCTSSSTAPCNTPTNTTTPSTSTSTTTTTSRPTSTTTSTTTSTPTTTKTTPVTPGTGDTTTTTQHTSTTTKASEPFVCPANANGNYPNPNGCTTFYMCSNGTPYLYDCPSNLVFNPATGYCDYPSNVPSCSS